MRGPLRRAALALAFALAASGCERLDGLWRAEDEPQVPAPAAPPLALEEIPPPPAPPVLDRPVFRPVAFAPGSDAIDAEQAIVLDITAGALRERPELRVRLEGHAEASGPDAGAPGLAARRAEAVRRFLVRKGVADERLAALGAEGAGAGAAGGPHGRRVELVLAD